MSSRDSRTAGPLRFAKVFLSELELLGQKAHAGPDGEPRFDLESAREAVRLAERIPRPEEGADPSDRAYWVAWDAATSSLYEAAGRAAPPLSALCLSGGGIRSATFGLGVMQALARRGLLPKFDYLSSVSGGGYVAAWLQSWIARWGAARDARDYVAALGKVPRDAGTTPGDPPSSPHAPEPRPVEHLREYGNYLTPRLGLFSGDSWALVAIVLRNILLNWLVFLPILAAGMGIPVAVAAVFAVDAAPSRPWIMASLAVAALGAASSFVLERWRAAGTAGTTAREDSLRRAGAVGSAILLAVASVLFAWSVRGAFASSLSVVEPALLGLVAAWTLGAPLLGWLAALLAPPFSSGRRVRREELALLLSGAAAGVALVAAIIGWNALRETWGWLAAHAAGAFAVVAPPILVLALLVARSLFIALTSHGEDATGATEGAGDRVARGEAGREWWARHSGLLIMLSTAWALLVAIGGAGEWLLGSAWTAVATGALWGAAGGGASLAGMSARTPFGPELKKAAGRIFRDNWIVVAAAVGLVALLSLLGAAEIYAGRALCGAAIGGAACTAGAFLAVAELSAAAVFLGLGLLLGLAVDVNRFSLQGLYRNRLVRAFLGASRGGQRHADPFTGLDPDDDRPLASLTDPARNPRPLSIFNATLNLVAGRNLAWQERKGESFSMTPLFCGNFHDGYRPTKEYAGTGGISLGMAVAISGAAASPNMGYHSSPLVTFVMALFNARLGSWLPNPGDRGDGVQQLRGPRNAALALFRELFGRTDAEGSYVNLSDGGHFDNLGIYEAVLRRCRLVVVSDASDDAKSRFEELGNAIRKIRIDFGIRIDFEKGLGIHARGRPGESYAIARIRYDDVDGVGATPGVLVYLKPTVAVKERPIPADVRAYASRSRSFPHESTLDQWFSESQFESYRRLGEFLADAAIESLEQGIPESEAVAEAAAFVESALSGLDATPPAQGRPGSAAPMAETH